MASFRPKAFTLVELLVVITIIATLAALLLPAMKAAKDRVKTSACANNCRQFGTAMTSFLGDNNQWYPYSAPNGATCRSAGKMWHVQLGPYVGGANSLAAARVFYCPANPWSLPNTTLAGGSPTTYGLNSQVLPSNWNSVGSSGYCPTNGSTDLWPRSRSTQFAHPAGLMISGEIPYCGNWTESPWGLMLPDGTASCYAFVDMSYWVAPWIALRCLGNCHPQVIVNHKLAWNSLMGDGHVQLVTKAAMISQANTAWNLGNSALWNDGLFPISQSYLDCPYPY